MRHGDPVAGGFTAETAVDEDQRLPAEVLDDVPPDRGEQRPHRCADAGLPGLRSSEPGLDGSLQRERLPDLEQQRPGACRVHLDDLVRDGMPEGLKVRAKCRGEVGGKLGRDHPSLLRAFGLARSPSDGAEQFRRVDFLYRSRSSDAARTDTCWPNPLIRRALVSMAQLMYRRRAYN